MALGAADSSAGIPPSFANALQADFLKSGCISGKFVGKPSRTDKGKTAADTAHAIVYRDGYRESSCTSQIGHTNLMVRNIQELWIGVLRSGGKIRLQEEEDEVVGAIRNPR
jgi:hypothetical protein